MKSHQTLAPSPKRSLCCPDSHGLVWVEGKTLYSLNIFFRRLGQIEFSSASQFNPRVHSLFCTNPSDIKLTTNDSKNVISSLFKLSVFLVFNKSN